MAKILSVNADVISIGMDDGSLREVPASSVTFVPHVGDKVEVFQTADKIIVSKVEEPAQPAAQSAPAKASGPVKGKGAAIAGFVCSILGVILGFINAYLSIVSLPVSIVGLVLSVVGGKKLRETGGSTGLATAGLIIGIVAVIMSTILFFSCGICVLCVTAAAATV